MALNHGFLFSKLYGRGKWCLIFCVSLFPYGVKPVVLPLETIWERRVVSDFFVSRRVRLPDTPARVERCVTPSDIRRNLVFEFDKREGAQRGKISG